MTPRHAAHKGATVPKAIYEGIYRDLKGKIQEGTYAYGDFLRTEKDLTDTYRCSRNTLRRAVSMLADDAYVQPLHGRGVRVIWQRDQRVAQGSLDGVESFGEYAGKNDARPATSVKSFEHVTCGKGLAQRTGFEEGSRLVRVVRVRSLDGAARQVDHDYFLESAVGDLTPQVAEGSVYRYLEEDLGMKILTSRRRITVQLATDEDCSYLDLGAYNCVAVIESQSFNSEGVMFEYTQVRHHPEQFSYNTISRR
jgi:GntR family trehalose operon transcriptional repressor